jgi:hypothetical protein
MGDFNDASGAGAREKMTYEDYLVSNLQPRDLLYITDRTLARQLIELGHDFTFIGDYSRLILFFPFFLPSFFFFLVAEEVKF